jgi:hypothetical protein
MPLPIVPHRSRRARFARCLALIVGLATLPAHRPARGDDPPLQDRKSAGRILVRALDCGTEPGVKPEGIIALDPDDARAEITYPLLAPGEPSPDGRFVAYTNHIGEEGPGIWVYRTR